MSCQQLSTVSYYTKSVHDQLSTTPTHSYDFKYIIRFSKLFGRGHPVAFPRQLRFYATVDRVPCFYDRKYSYGRKFMFNLNYTVLRSVSLLCAGPFPSGSMATAEGLRVWVSTDGHAARRRDGPLHRRPQVFLPAPLPPHKNHVCARQGAAPGSVVGSVRAPPPLGASHLASAATTRGGSARAIARRDEAGALLFWDANACPALALWSAWWCSAR